MINYSREAYLDLIKAFAILGVVIIHSTGPILYQFGTVREFYWMLGNIFETIVMMSVPLFYMVTGALLLPAKNETLATYYTKRVRRVVVPFLLWSIIYIFFKKYFVGFYNIAIPNEIFKIFSIKQYYHLGFLYSLIGLYLFIPLLRVFTSEKSNNKNLFYYLILWIVFSMLFPLLEKLLGIKLVNIMPMLSGYFGYLILGYLLSRLNITKKYLIFSVILIGISTLISIYGTAHISTEEKKYSTLFHNYIGIFTMVQAISWFIFFKYLGENIIILQSKNIYYLSVASFGIYLFHPIVLFFLQKSGVHVLNGYHPIYMIPITVILTYSISLIVVKLLLKLPLINTLLLGENKGNRIYS